MRDNNRHHQQDNGNYEALISLPSHVVRASPPVRLLSVLVALANAAAALPPRWDGTSCAHLTHTVIQYYLKIFSETAGISAIVMLGNVVAAPHVDVWQSICGVR
jgi:hypothetical protein